MNETQQINSALPLTAILIDDDELVRLTWELAARTRKINILTFASDSEFQSQRSQIPPHTPIYIDLNLNLGINGLDVAKTLAAQGFDHLYISTGNRPETVLRSPWILGVIDKTPPWMDGSRLV